MKLIIGLGNPGSKYKSTRHNIGASVVDVLYEKHSTKLSEFNYKKKYNSELSEGVIGSEKVVIMKPLTFMNNVGQAVKKVIETSNFTESDIVVVQDDSDLDIGKIKVKQGGEGAGHKGIESLRNNFNIDQVIRILIGIRDPKLDSGKKSLSFVLKNFPKDQINLIKKVKQRAALAITFLIENGEVEQARNEFNGIVK